MISGLNAASLFAGVGGFEEAMRRHDIKTPVSVENDKAACGVLADRFPGTTVLNDVTEVTGDDLRSAGFDPRRGILTAGWPCQGNSAAGRRQGMDDARSGLWRHVVRLLAETRPIWFFGENVPGLLAVNKGRDFLRVVADLDDLGYGVAWRVLDAQHFGVPQRRRRVFIVGHLGDGAAPAQVLLEPEGGGRDSAPLRAEGQDVAGTLGGGSGNRGWADGLDRMTFVPVANSLMSHGGNDKHDPSIMTYVSFDAAQITSAENRSNPQPGDPAPSLASTGRPMVAATLTTNPSGGGRRQEDDQNVVTHTLTAEGSDASEDGTGRGTPLTADGVGVRRLSPLECERLQGYPDGWTTTSNGRPQSDAARYRQMGNSVAVPAVEWVVRRIVACDEAVAA